ncbi:hypothetical protein OEZ86_009964 [Tetradesmus obliquus]|uniref:Uncharacterized protein n=1 Tax=Tetradesmus obliquus TaxID=3088 RepID=A0ABY8UNC0_TETOB|nr:hypothetical protein OEZ85_001398 [Tetradesmus obliquus]WIA43502.1 hypothetical protein OEZ86_009964 [Tetradesmus obliquus]
MTTAQSHLQVPDSELECVIWIDAKTMYMVVNSKYGWAMAGDEDTYETAFPPTLKNPMKLKYYIAVNYRLGALLLVFYTGTTGMPADRDPNRVYLTKKGKRARAVTSEEWTKIMQLFREEAEKPANLAKLGAREQWKYSWDNDKVHKGADLSTIGIEDEDRFYLPELSSDMHKVVEHVHGWLQGRMQKWLALQDKATLTVAQCKAELMRLFTQELDISSIQKDVRTLKDTYQAVVDAEGGYVKKQHRETSMKVYEDGQRVLAALSFAEAKCNIDAATKEFRKHCRALKLKVPADARGFVLRWGQEWAKDSSVNGKASNSGRPRKLSAEQVQQVLDVILQWRADGKNSPYESIAQLKKRVQ